MNLQEYFAKTAAARDAYATLVASIEDHETMNKVLDMFVEADMALATAIGVDLPGGVESAPEEA